MLSLLSTSKVDASGLLSSSLFDETTFYTAFIRDLNRCTSEAIIESPFMTGNRVASLLPIFSKMISRGISITVNTKPPSEFEVSFELHASNAIERLQAAGIQVLFTGGHHRKLAILDRRVLWEGSLNILSQNDSCEIMRRVASEQLAIQMIQFTGLNRWCGDIL